MAGVMYNYFKELFISMKVKKDIVTGGLMAGMLGFLLQSMTDHTWYNYRVFMMFWVIVGISIVSSKINMQSKSTYEENK